MSVLDKISRFFFPERCVFCGALSVDGEPCDECLVAATECEIVGEICLKCGNAKNKCECSKVNYLFNGVAAVYYNMGVAKEGVYGIKIAHRPFAAKYFGNRMANVFKENLALSRMLSALCLVITELCAIEVITMPICWQKRFQINWIHLMIARF